MAETEQKKTTTEDAEAPSMEEILQSIRGVISGDDVSEQEKNQEDEDVLELTEMIEDAEEGKASAVAATGENPEDSNADGKSILDDIDAALDDKKEENAAAEEGGATPEGEESSADAAAGSEEKGEQEKEPEAMAEPEAAAQETEDMKEEEAQEEDESSLSSAGSDDTLEAHPEDAGGSESGEVKTVKSERLIADAVARESAVPLKELVSGVHERHGNSPHTRGGTSLEDLVIEAMKPFLSEWLNKNLPGIVRKIVEKEVRHLVPKEDD